MRIVSLLSSATEMLFALGLGAQVLAVSHECDWPSVALQLPRATRSRIDSRQSSLAIDSQVKQLLASGESLYEVDESLLRQLAPDLIITQAQCDVCAIRLADVLRLQDECEELKRTRVLSLNPNSLEDMFQDILRIGAATNAATQAAALVGSYRQRIATIIDRTAMLPPRERPRVLCIEWINPLMPAGNWTPQLVEFAGGISGLATSGEHSRYADWADVAAFDPQLIIVMPCGFDLPRTLHATEELKSLREWPGLTAVRNRQVFAVDGNALLNRSGPRLIESLEVLAQLIQTKLFPDFGHSQYWQQLTA